jgi:hypothetical protein
MPYRVLNVSQLFRAYAFKQFICSLFSVICSYFILTSLNCVPLNETQNKIKNKDKYKDIYKENNNFKVLNKLKVYISTTFFSSVESIFFLFNDL